MKQPQSYAKIENDFHMLSNSILNFFDYLFISTCIFRDDPDCTVQEDTR